MDDPIRAGLWRSQLSRRELVPALGDDRVFAPDTRVDPRRRPGLQPAGGREPDAPPVREAPASTCAVTSLRSIRSATAGAARHQLNRLALLGPAAPVMLPRHVLRPPLRCPSLPPRRAPDQPAARIPASS